MIRALNHDMPYDDFVRAQILGNRYKPETSTTATAGDRSKVEGTVEDTFALGFLARAAVTRNDKDHDIPFAAVETVSTAFMGMTVGCAKCHDHKFDPIRQKDFYAMKAHLRSAGAEERHARHAGGHLRQRPEAGRVTRGTTRPSTPRSRR